MNRFGQYYLNIPVEHIKSYSSRPNACCAECKHFEPTALDAEARRQGLSGHAVMGQCHRFPPTGTGAAAFMPTYADYYCGEFGMVYDDRLPFAKPLL